MSLDELIEFDVDLMKIEQNIKNSNEEKEAKIDWTNAWSKKYPVLATYQQEVRVEDYKIKIGKMLKDLKNEYKYSDLDSMLVLKDILYHVWKDNNK